MVSHSAISKSRAILICILVIGALAEVSAYYYVQNFTSFPSSSSSGAIFQVANLTISPFEARLNQPINISVGVANVGNIQGSYSLSLNINNLTEETKKLTLSVNESQVVAFSVTEANEGSYNVSIGDLVGLFSVMAKPTPMPTTLKVANLFINPIEAWPGQQVNISVDLTNTGSENISYSLPFFVNGQDAQRTQVELAPSVSTSLTVALNETKIGTYPVTCGGQNNQFSIVETGKHTLHYITTHYGIPFTLDGVAEIAPYTALVDVGPHTLVVPASAQVSNPGWGLTTYAFNSWNDGNTSLSKTVNVQNQIYVVSTYIRLGSCPSLYVWNGTDYEYSAEVSDGSGWLGYLDHFQTDGTMVFSNNYPFDYIKLDSTQLQPINGYYNMKIAEMSDEIFYLDQAKMVAIDHPAGTNVFSTTSTFIYNLAGQGTYYTVSTNPAAPVSAVDGKGQNVLSQISKMDEAFTDGARWAWNNITLNLGNLAGAKEIKLVVGAKITWPTTQAGGNNFMKYANQPGVTPSPPPYMEVKDQYGNWIRVPDNREFPFPDVTDNIFVVNLTGLFPTNDFELRINTYQNIQFDYIGVDTTAQQNTIIHTIMPSSADLEQAFSTDSNSSGAFTKYGNVNALLLSADDKFVIGREGDAVSLQFPANLSPVPKGMVRDYFVVASCWFKGKGLSYVPFTVDPLPFQAMTSFPYPPTESYPYDSVHQAYLAVYNTRIIN